MRSGLGPTVACTWTIRDRWPTWGCWPGSDGRGPAPFATDLMNTRHPVPAALVHAIAALLLARLLLIDASAALGRWWAALLLPPAAASQACRAPATRPAPAAQPEPAPKASPTRALLAAASAADADALGAAPVAALRAACAAAGCRPGRSRASAVAALLAAAS